MTNFRRTFLFAALLLVTSRVHSQPTIRLDKPQSTSADGFTEVVAVEELPDGSVIAVDRRERRIARIDLTRGTVANISRQGQGPREYTGTYALSRWLGDTLLVYGSREFLKLAPNGDAVGKFAISTDIVRRRGFGPPLFSDKSGRLYYESNERPAPAADGNFGPILRKVIVRFDPRTGANDTVAATLQTRDPNGPFSGPWRPYAAADAFALLNNGDIAVLRARDYSIEIIDVDGACRAGPFRIAYTPVRVTAAERDAFRDDMLRRPAGSAMSTAAGSVSRMSDAERQQARRQLNIPDDAFPATLPPFTDEFPVRVDPAGNMWIRRSFGAGASDHSYDVVDTHGRVLRRVVIPKRGRVVGFGRNAVYVVKHDEDDMQWVERHELR